MLTSRSCEGQSQTFSSFIVFRGGDGAVSGVSGAGISGCWDRALHLLAGGRRAARAAGWAAAAYLFELAILFDHLVGAEQDR